MNHFNSLPFLDILISRSKNGFKTSVYQKPTCSGAYSIFNSFIYDQYKIGLIFTLLLRTFSIVSEVSHLKEILGNNLFSIKLVDNCIITFLNKTFLHTPVALAVEKKELFIILPHRGNLSRSIRTRLQSSINKNLLFVRSRLFLSPRHVLVIFSVLKTKCLLTYALILFTNSRVVDAMLPIRAKHADI